MHARMRLRDTVSTLTALNRCDQNIAQHRGLAREILPFACGGGVGCVLCGGGGLVVFCVAVGLLCCVVLFVVGWRWCWWYALVSMAHTNAAHTKYVDSLTFELLKIGIRWIVLIR